MEQKDGILPDGNNYSKGNPRKALAAASDYTTVHIVIGHSFAGSLKQALLQYGRIPEHRIVVLAEHYAVGPLRDLDSAEGREKRSRWFCNHIAEAREAYNGFEAEYAALVAQLAQIPEQAEVVVWAGANASEQAGLRHALHLLQGKPNIVAMYNPCAICEKLFNRPDASIQYRHSGEIPPNKLHQALLTLDGSGRLTAAARSALEQEWLALAEQSGNLRIWQQDRVTEVPEDFFDKYLLEKLDSLRAAGDESFLKAARLIGEALGYCEQNIPDSYFEYRLRELAYAGVLEIEGVPAAMRYYSVRRKPAEKQVSGGRDAERTERRSIKNSCDAERTEWRKAEHSQEDCRKDGREAVAQRPPVRLRTSRLILKPAEDVRAEAVLDYFMRNQEFLAEWEIRRQPQFFTLEAQKQMLLEDKANTDKGQLVKLWLCKAEEPDRVIGSVALSNIVRGAFQACHLGYRLDGKEQEKGYMTEAVREIIEYAFQKLGLHRIEANIMPRNLASLKVTEKLGFYHEGLAKSYLRINGKWEDHIHMVLLNEEMD